MAKGTFYTNEFKENAVRLLMSPGKAAVKTGEVQGGPRVDHKSGSLFRTKGVTSNQAIGR